jgi:hypothetical protein
MSVKWGGPGERLWLIGPATKVFEGTIDLNTMRRQKS